MNLQQLRPDRADTSNASRKEPAGPQRNIVVRKMVYPARAPRLRRAMRMVDRKAIGRTTRRRWRRNGLGIGCIERSRVPLLLGNTVKPRRINVYTIRNPSRYNPLTLVEHTSSQVCRFHTADGAERVELKRGASKLMLKLLPPMEGDDGPPRLDLLPHHNVDRPTLIPKTPRQQRMNGRSFDALRVDEPVAQDRVWVIWPTGAAPSADDEAEPGSTGADASPRRADGTTPTTSEQERPDEPSRLGEALLTGRRDGEPVQIVLLIAVE